MKISETDQRHLLSALRLQMEDFCAEIQTGRWLLKGSHTPNVRNALKQDLKGALEMKREIQDLINRIKTEVVQ
jgi:hypothetical protein